jgi:hypothetical protein
MPNYVTHRIILTGDDMLLRAIADRHFKDILNHDGKATCHTFDFDSIIPMPESLSNIERDGVSQYDEMLGELATGKPYPNKTFEAGHLVRRTKMHTLAAMRETFARVHPPCGGATSYGNLLKLLADAPPTVTQSMPRVEMSYTELAVKIGTAIADCGYGDTLEWCTEVWGTKWGSFRARVERIGNGELEFRFETAWSPPSPVFRKFAAMYPSVGIHGFAFDEGWNFEAEIVGAGGFCATERRTATKAVYEYVYRKPYLVTDENGNAEDLAT